MLIRLAIWSIFSALLATHGFPVTTWEFWSVMILPLLFIIFW